MKVVEATYSSDPTSSSSMSIKDATSLTYRIKIEDRQIANAVLSYVRKVLGDRGVSGWLKTDAETAKRALLDAVLKADKSAQPTVVVAGRNEVRLSHEATQRVQRVAAALSISESDVVNWLVLAYSPQLLPKKRGVVFNPLDVEDVAQKLVAALNSHSTRTLARSVLARKKHFSSINEDILQAAIDRLKQAGEIIENGKSLMLNPQKTRGGNAPR